MNSWRLYNQAKEWSKLPSEILFIADEFVAYCVNEATYAFGAAIENEVNGLKKGKTEKDERFAQRKRSLLMKLLEAPDQQRFAPPAPTK